ncbi:hypothetical protein [Pontibacter rugosus]
MVAQNKSYELLYSSAEKRIYLAIKGFWKNTSVAPDYLEDLQKTIDLTVPGFSVLLDLRNMITHPQKVMCLHVEAHKLLMDAGLKIAASIEPDDHIFALQIDDMVNKSQLPLSRFTSYNQAEAWIKNQ